ncbi:MAG: M3 family oligoendopeptidase [Bacteroidota bacterium]|nr:M3 family oligoendopeptidase [Bacteroidota bacterium]
MKFSQYPYKRINLEKFRKDTEGMIDDFKSAKSAEEQIEIIQTYQKIQKEIQTYASIANLNFARDTKNNKNIEENKFYDEITPEIAAIDNQFTKTIDCSKFKNELLAKFGQHFFNLISMELKSFDPKLVKLMKEENELTNEYRSLLAGAEMQYKGKTLNLAGLSPYMQDIDRETRKEAYELMDGFFSKNERKLDVIFDKLVKVRDKKGEVLGFKNFIPLGYLNMNRSDYGDQEVAEYRKQIVKHIVPLVKKINAKRKDILGYEKMFVYDTLYFKEGNPKPKGGLNFQVKQAEKMYSELSEETKSFFNMMINEELMDLENRAGKSGGGFCTSFPSLERPYIFANFNGTDHDVTVLTHEAGHAFQGYQSRKQPVNRYLWPTYEACEIHSMSMEFLTWDWMHLFFKEDTDKFLFKHLAGSLAFLPYGALVDHFQHWIYENPKATPKERKMQWLELENIYQPGKHYDNLDFLKNGGFWQKQAHIYEMPFYYIDYTLAQVCAFQFWIRMKEDKESAWNDYLKLCKAGGSMSFLDLVKLANIKSPFDPKVFEEVATKINNWLSKNSL